MKLFITLFGLLALTSAFSQTQIVRCSAESKSGACIINGEKSLLGTSFGGHGATPAAALKDANDDCQSKWANSQVAEPVIYKCSKTFKQGKVKVTISSSGKDQLEVLEAVESH